MFFRRGLGDPPDPWLRVKLWLFGAGAIVALLGMGLESDWLIGAAGLVLAAGLLSRFLPAPGGNGGEDDSPEQRGRGAEDRDGGKRRGGDEGVGGGEDRGGRSPGAGA